VEPKRPGLPVNMTPQCHLSAAAPNHIHVTWTPEIGRVSTVLLTRFAVKLVKYISPVLTLGVHLELYNPSANPDPEFLPFELKIGTSVAPAVGNIRSSWFFYAFLFSS